MTEFTQFPKIPRLSRDIMVTEKIDGTNASILIPEDDGPIQAGSRTRWITPEDDNAGFARWVKTNEAQLRVELGYGLHYGEWWGSGIQRGYGLTKGEKRFSLFNVTRWESAPLKLCHVVPLLYDGGFDTAWIDRCVDDLRKFGSMAVPGFMKPEGVVIFHKAANVLFKKTVEKDEQSKGEIEAFERWKASQGG